MTEQTRVRRSYRHTAWSRAIALWLFVVASVLVVAAIMAGPAHASTTFTVNSYGDAVDVFPGDGGCGTGSFSKLNGTEECTLRAAIQESNTSPGEDTIDFDIPGTGIHTIQINSGGYGSLPEITDQVTIDGYTVSSAKKGAGKITVKGKLNSNPNQTFVVQHFKNPRGTRQEKTLLGQKTVTTDGSGYASIAFSTTKKVRLGQNITATATNTSTGDASEFSAPRKVVAT